MTAKSTVDIYVLCDPDTGKIRYAGKANSAEARLKSHLRDCKKTITPVRCWVASLVEAGKVPLIEVMMQAPADDWTRYEIAFIAKLRSLGVRLLNVADGGDQPSQTLEQRQSNGRKAAIARSATPRSKRIWQLKRDMGSYLKTAEKNAHYYEIVRKLKYSAAKRPDLFGAWSTL